MAKLGTNISEYPGPILTYFTDFVGVLVGMIIPIFVWWSPKGHCYGNQLNLEDVRRRRQERPSLFASAFDNGLADCIKITWQYSGYIMYKFGEHPPIITEFTLLKCAFFAAILLQFDDAFHS